MIFVDAVNRVLANEGAYTNDPEDAGGPTHWGIILDVLKQEGLSGDVDHDGDVDTDDIKILTKEQAVQIYKRQWWERYRYDSIIKTTSCIKIFDCAVNMGQQQATLITQRTLRACDLPVKEDGIFGPKTRAAVNTTDGLEFLAAYRSEMAGVYRLILAKHPDYEIFRVGWLRRAYQ